MISSLPTLTIDGFVTNKYILIRKLFEYFLASDYSQSNTFQGKVASLKYILATKHPTLVSEEIQNTLKRMYLAYYEQVSVHTWVEEKGAKMHIYVDIVAEEDGKKYSLAKEVKATKGDIENYEQLLDELWAEYNKKDTYE